eukprot:TRINITY_DN3046_c0_g1_i1.p1 TRINITY_DN3046_c0_g1~~TRINITY_DN3046_c0_g1_i1.p1  ORF type:complete len:357 (-),score=89.51 TRINITY_DN3046_c0_g1_i1:14-1084(-)
MDNTVAVKQPNTAQPPVVDLGIPFDSKRIIIFGFSLIWIFASPEAVQYDGFATAAAVVVVSILANISKTFLFGGNYTQEVSKFQSKLEGMGLVSVAFITMAFLVRWISRSIHLDVLGSMGEFMEDLIFIFTLMVVLFPYPERGSNVAGLRQQQLTFGVVVVIITFMALMLDLSLPLKPYQLVWLTLFTEGMASSFINPRFAKADQHDDLTPAMYRSVIFNSIYQVAILSILMFAPSRIPQLGLTAEHDGLSLQTHQTIIFTTLALFQLFGQLNNRIQQQDISIFQNLDATRFFLFLVEFILLVLFNQICALPNIAILSTLTKKQWVTCAILAGFSLPLRPAIQLIPVPKIEFRRRP